MKKLLISMIIIGGCLVQETQCGVVNDKKESVEYYKNNRKKYVKPHSKIWTTYVKGLNEFLALGEAQKTYFDAVQEAEEDIYNRKDLKKTEKKVDSAIERKPSNVLISKNAPNREKWEYAGKVFKALPISTRKGNGKNDLLEKIINMENFVKNFIQFEADNKKTEAGGANSSPNTNGSSSATLNTPSKTTESAKPTVPVSTNQSSNSLTSSTTPTKPTVNTSNIATKPATSGTKDTSTTSKPAASTPAKPATITSKKPVTSPSSIKKPVTQTPTAQLTSKQMILNKKGAKK